MAPSPPPPPPPPPVARDAGAASAGTLGLSALGATDGGLAGLMGGGVISGSMPGLDHLPDWPRSRPAPPGPRGIVELTAPSADAGGAGLTLHRNLRQTLSRIRSCYERGLRRTPALAGELTLRLNVAADRSVGAVATPSSTVGEEVNACAQALLRRWQYPAPVGAPFTVEMKVKLRPAPADAGRAGD
jgi:hypothetical protein